MRSLMKTVFMACVPILLLSAVANASHPIQVLSQLANSKYHVLIEGWGDENGNLSPSGTTILTLMNERNDDVETQIVLNSHYNKLILDGTGSHYDVLVSLGDSLKSLGGIKGFAATLSSLVGQSVSFPANSEQNDLAVALIDSTGKVTLIDSGKISVSPR